MALWITVIAKASENAIAMVNSGLAVRNAMVFFMLLCFKLCVNIKR